jgi:AsmA protein
MKSHMVFTDVDLESCLNDLFGAHHLEGRGTLSYEVEGSGSSIMGLAQALSGETTLTASNGALTGFNVEHSLRQLERSPLSVAGELRGGRTPFDRLRAKIKIAEGTANLDEFEIDGPAIRLALGGSASIPAREFNLQGTAGLIPAANTATAAPELPFVVRGSWDDFQVTPDPRSLINRSGAAIPLLNAVRDRKAREDAIRSTIERWTGGPVKPASPPADGQFEATEPRR